MRKDVKIGLAIAGVLVVLLVVYAIIPHNKETKSTAQNTDGQVEVGTDVPPTEPETPTPTETPAPLKAKDPFGTATDAPTTNKNNVDINHPDAPLISDSGSGAGTNWGQILTSGQLPKAEKGNGAPPLYTTNPTSPANGSGGSAKPGDARSSTELKPSDSAKPERPLYGSDSPTRPAGTSTIENPPIVPMTPAGSSGTGERTHVIQKGETLSSIAEVAYGSSKLYTLIQKANPDLDDRHLKVGASIKLPERGDSSRSTSVSSRKSTGASSGAPALTAVEKSAGGAATSTNSSTEYRVKAGDTLYGIAVKLYGKGNRMHKLADFNKSTLGNDPDSLKIGTVLKLPEPPTVSGASR